MGQGLSSYSDCGRWRVTKLALLWACSLSILSGGCGQSDSQSARMIDRSKTASPVITRRGEPNPTASELLAVQPPGVHEQTIIGQDGRLLRFTISVPGAYSSDQPSPLIVALHFGGQVTPFFGRGVIDALVGPGLRELQAVIIAPDSTGGDWTEAGNEQAVLEVMDRVTAAYNIDQSKTLLTGFSMGGAGTWHLAARHQDRFACAIPIAGQPQADVDWTIPLYVIHSRLDSVVPIGPTQKYVEKLKTKGEDVELVVIDGVTHFETPRFAEPLREAIPWIRRQWQK